MFEGPVLEVVMIIALFIIMEGIVLYYHRENKKQDALIDKLSTIITMQQMEIDELKREKDFKEKYDIKAD